jgi:hypothetical protein
VVDAVKRTHGGYVDHLENENKTKLAEMAEKQKIIEAEQHKVNEKKDIQDQVTECDRLEHAQILEHNCARKLIF